MKALKYSAIRDWLISLGFLEESTDDNGRKIKRPTQQGSQLGITLDMRNGSSGTYFVTLYSLDAQHFIMDNIDSIIEFERSGKENQGQPWTEEQDRCLLDMYRKGCSMPEIAAKLKRNTGAIRARLKKFGTD